MKPVDTGLLGNDQYQLKKEKTEEPTFLYNECSYWLSRSMYSWDTREGLATTIVVHGKDVSKYGSLCRVLL